jgi:hypothetical protein
MTPEQVDLLTGFRLPVHIRDDRSGAPSLTVSATAEQDYLAAVKGA